MGTNNYGELGRWLLGIISKFCQGYYIAYHISALEEQVESEFKHDLERYASLIAYHIDQKNLLESTNPMTLSTLKEGNFCVEKSNLHLSAIFSDQGLEQWIKDIKGVVVGITQGDEALDRFIIAAPYITKMVRYWKHSFPSSLHFTSEEHYQL